MGTYLLLILSALLTLANATIKVAIVDTGLDLTDPRFTPYLCKEGHRDFTGEGIKDINGHGTHIAGIAKSNEKCYCLVILKYYTDRDSAELNLMHSIDAFEEAVKYDIVNFSSSGSEPNDYEYQLIKSHPNTLFVVAAGNNKRNLDLYPTYPGCYNLKNIILVGNKGSSSSNYGNAVKAWEYGDDVLSTLPHNRQGRLSGTSMAAAIHTHKLIEYFCREQ